MKILKHGKKFDGSMKFKCSLCGCVYEVDRKNLKQTWNPRDSETITSSQCPEKFCGHTNIKIS